MHGRPRQPKGVFEDPEKAVARGRKLSALRQLSDSVLKGVRDGERSEKVLKLSSQLLVRIPDLYTVWNFRKRALLCLLEEGKGQPEGRALAADELRLTEAALLENCKSYAAWHHRLWVVRLGLVPLTSELQLVGRFLRLDSRNFHAWQYRQQILRLHGSEAEEELAYTRSLIDANFSNYSAWHVRASLLAELHQQGRVLQLRDLFRPVSGQESRWQQLEIPAASLGEEFDLVQHAFFTDPEDQSAYIYHRWLLKVLMARHAGAEPAGRDSTDEVMTVLRREASRCEDLLEVETDRRRCKWPLLALAHMLHLQLQLRPDSGNIERRGQLLVELTSIDPLRRGFYADSVTQQ